ncbi:MAG: isoprenylcysteine carboxylmethyltransferase family protein [Gammaproteobacteria bacterium]|nr:isoprenylcysteine carboxylmethyltransferase family protein [Gammaproteobacteria bacterium]
MAFGKIGERKEGRGPLPPVYLLLGILLQVGFHYAMPLAVIVSRPYNWSGIALIVAGVLIIVFPAASFSKADTTIIPFRESSSLVVSGLYRYTRNPMYLGMLIILVGVALLTGSLSPFVVPLLFVLVINKMIISVEERMLEREFGEEYRDYRKSVRRWI